MKRDKFDSPTAITALLIVSLFWGLGFPTLKILDDIPTFFIQTVRFGISSAIIVIFFHKRLKNIDKNLLIKCLSIGFLFFLSYVAATVGIKYTTSARSSFFTCLGAICVPFINFIVFRIVPKTKVFIAVIICVIGVYLISMGNSTDLGLNLGDLICLATSFFASGYVVGLEHVVRERDTVVCTVVVTVELFVLSLICFLILGENIPQTMDKSQIASLIFLGVCASAIAFLLQSYAQKRISANRAALILTLEPVIGGISSVIFLKESMGVLGWIGAGVVVFSIILSEYGSEQKE